MIEKDTKILIIDDEIDICNQLSGLLGDLGYECVYSTSSEQGIEIFRKTNISLVLLDIWLNNSKFDGFQALEKIQSIESKIPVISIVFKFQKTRQIIFNSLLINYLSKSSHI